MPVIALPHKSAKRVRRRLATLSPHTWEVVWAILAVASFIAMALWPVWQTVPFYFVWISLTLLYGLRVWSLRVTAAVLLFVTTVTAALILIESIEHMEDWKALLKVPLMATLFLVMVWHARRRVDALNASRTDAADLQAALERQERFIQDASHELRTPVTIARGHLELARGPGRPELEIAIDELRRIDTILEKLLLLANAGQPDFLRIEQVELEPFLEDVFMRWSEVAPRSWRLGPIVPAILRADPERLRAALDALLENAVKYSDAYSEIELRARWDAFNEVVIEVEDEGIGIPREALSRVFARFGRADSARTRAAGGVGLGLAIVEAIAVHHGGRCSVQSSVRGSVFSLHLPLVETEQVCVLEHTWQLKDPQY